MKPWTPEMHSPFPRQCIACPASSASTCSAAAHPPLRRFFFCFCGRSAWAVAGVVGGISSGVASVIIRADDGVCRSGQCLRPGRLLLRPLCSNCCSHQAACKNENASQHVVQCVYAGAGRAGRHVSCTKSSPVGISRSRYRHIAATQLHCAEGQRDARSWTRVSRRSGEIWDANGLCSRSVALSRDAIEPRNETIVLSRDQPSIPE